MRSIMFLACAVLFSAAGYAADQFAELKFSIVREESGKPIRNATVVLHPLDKEGKQAKGGLQLKTDTEGNAEFRGAPYGKLRIQVIARGYQTHGEDYDIDQPTEEIVIKMKRPQQQYSIYEDEKQK